MKPAGKENPDRKSQITFSLVSAHFLSNCDSHFLLRETSCEVMHVRFLFLCPQLSLQEVLGGAVQLAEEGFPVAKVTAHHWAHWVAELRRAGKELGGDLLIDGQAPNHGQVFRNPALAQTLKVNT